MMRRPAAAALLLSTVLAASAHAQGEATPLSQASWLTGCWSGGVGSEQVEENWMPLRAGTLVGAARGTRGERTTSVELTIIRMRGDTLAYHAFPVGQAPAVFPVESVNDSAMVFANPAHDFPQRISYRRVGADSAVARIEGPGENGPRGFDYHLRRVSCPAASP
jgi:hypothetical protein